MAESDAHSDDLLHSSRMIALSQEDRSLSMALVMGVLRRQISLDGQIGPLLARPGQVLAEPVAVALRMGAFQLLHMDRIPPHAAVHESVELCRVAGHAHAAGMVNAVLRKVAGLARANEQAEPGDAKRRLPIFEPAAGFAQRLGHPAWLVERWVTNYGRETARAICEYDQREPASGSFFCDSASEDDASLPAVPFQIDDGSRLVAELAAAALPDRDQTPRVWDCCAAPGGKTLVLAERLPQSNILATDISARRLARMKERLAGSQHGVRIRCEVMDAADPNAPAVAGAQDSIGPFDLILCDVPCSGTGTFARNPEIRHRLKPEDLARQAARQRAILCGVIDRLAPGGRVLYSTCSLEPEENEELIEAVLADRPGIQRVPLEPMLAKLGRDSMLEGGVMDNLARTALREGCLRSVPGVHPCDGFFAALLERPN